MFSLRDIVGFQFAKKTTLRILWTDRDREDPKVYEQINNVIKKVTVEKWQITKGNVSNVECILSH